MKKILCTAFIICMTFGCVFANEITEDYFDMASSFCVEGNYREAINYLDKILLIEPDNKNVQDLRNGLRQILQGKNISFVLPKSNAVAQSVKYRRSGDKKGELSALSEGTDYWAYYFLGEYYKNDKEYSKAISYFVKSVNSKPSFNQCYLEIAICYIGLGNYSQAITYLNQYLKLNTNDDFAYALRAKCYSASGNQGDAMSDISTALEIENAVEYKLLRGEILYRQGKYFQALRELEKLTKEIQTAELYKYIGLSQAEVGDYADAIINLEKSIILSDDDSTVNRKYNELKTGIANEKT